MGKINLNTSIQQGLPQRGNLLTLGDGIGGYKSHLNWAVLNKLGGFEKPAGDIIQLFSITDFAKQCRQLLFLLRGLVFGTHKRRIPQHIIHPLS
ncbi:Uncharacterised protein [Candidatus Venteria ishoeyi]|uniref:Uncharacterized protein n=1 Tax=Candidatus Venteria ishoeyi TaxID=1899563 RepID=A0A1H6F5P4_9GAMM|nr:Uncharacterised protein [Candidatus Venteria ishoeyi]